MKQDGYVQTQWCSLKQLVKKHDDTMMKTVFCSAGFNCDSNVFDGKLYYLADTISGESFVCY